MADPIAVNTITPQKIDVKLNQSSKVSVSAIESPKIGVNLGPITIISQGPLSSLPDVQITSPTQNNVLSYSQSINKWVNKPEESVLDGGNF